jgi:hypothetical protein
VAGLSSRTFDDVLTRDELNNVVAILARLVVGLTRASTKHTRSAAARQLDTVAKLSPHYAYARETLRAADDAPLEYIDRSRAPRGDQGTDPSGPGPDRS